MAQRYEPFAFALYDPGWMVSTVMSITEDGGLDLRDQLQNDPSQAADQTSLGKNGEWYPLHEFIMPVVALAAIPLALAVQNRFQAGSPEPGGSTPQSSGRLG